MAQSGRAGGFSVLDLAALVMGSAIASIHVIRISRQDLSVGAWIMICLVFAGVTLTAAGPFVFLARRYVRKEPAYPKIGDQLWALLGLPWLVSAILKSAAPATEPRYEPLFTTTLSVGLGIVCMAALVVIWNTWIMVPPEKATRMESGPWTNRVGFIIAIAWPLQCGLGMIVLS
jgi:ribose/xylose/arabinose/galactoside ABC-type transport system permease subunit